MLNPTIMKKVITSLLGLAFFISAQAQEPRVDTVAVMIIDRMASVVGDLHSCSFTLASSVDIDDPDYGHIKQNELSKVYLSGPDKMHIDFSGDKGHRGFWYNGLTSIVYSFDENNYAIMDAPDNTVDMIDSIHEAYGIEFPAADFFYPTFTDDLLAYFDEIVFEGTRNLGDKECWLIIASNEDMNAQIWFSADAFTLPQRYVIVYKKEGNRQYEATFSNWNLNPDLPASVFEFMPPPQARQVSILPRTKR